MTRFAVAVIILALTGCVSWSPFPRPSPPLLAKADRLAAAGQYVDALDAYDELLAKYPDDSSVPRARARRDTVARLLAVQAELARVRETLVKRDAELARVRADLEHLKQIDMDLERRRR